MVIKWNSNWDFFQNNVGRECSKPTQERVDFLRSLLKVGPPLATWSPFNQCDVDLWDTWNLKIIFPALLSALEGVYLNFAAVNLNLFQWLQPWLDGSPSFTPWSSAALCPKNSVKYLKWIFPQALSEESFFLHAHSFSPYSTVACIPFLYSLT